MVPRARFPGGDARITYRSIQKTLALPPDIGLFMCRDYIAPERDEYRWETSVAEERFSYVHFGRGKTMDGFVEMRDALDKTLNMLTLILLSVQVRIRAGDLPPPEKMASGT